MSEKVNIYLDGAEEYDIMVGGEVFEFVIDRLIRHSYPDEKPEWEGEYLVRLECGNKAVLPWYDGDFYLDDYLTIDYIDDENPITHWWELPEVKE